MAASLLNSHAVVLAILAILGITVALSGNIVKADEQCRGDKQGLMMQCASFVEKLLPKRDPSDGCCKLIKEADVVCFCQHLSDAVQKVIDMDKVVYVSQFCSNPIPHGTKCGNYTVPV